MSPTICRITKGTGAIRVAGNAGQLNHHSEHTIVYSTRIRAGVLVHWSIRPFRAHLAGRRNCEALAALSAHTASK